MALATVAAVAGLALFGAAPASADTKSGITYDFVCESLGTFTIVNFSSGAASPGLDLGSNRVIQAYEWEVTVNGTPWVGEPFTRVFSYSRGEPQNGRLDYCTYTYVVTNNVGVGVFTGWAKISYTP
ncbi:MAG: hypothetical protein ABIQ05_09640 [Candidatus Limnocylindria bacterium]